MPHKHHFKQSNQVHILANLLKFATVLEQKQPQRMRLMQMYLYLVQYVHITHIDLVGTSPISSKKWRSFRASILSARRHIHEVTFLLPVLFLSEPRWAHQRKNKTSVCFLWCYYDVWQSGTWTTGSSILFRPVAATERSREKRKSWQRKTQHRNYRTEKNLIIIQRTAIVGYNYKSIQSVLPIWYIE